MKQVPCSIIRDLMVLYEDNVCSDESRQMIEEHIADCEECRRLCRMAESELPPVALREGERQEDGRDEFLELAKRACKKLERKLTYRHWIGFGILIVMIIMVVTVWEEWLRFRVNVVPSEDVRITELYELESGDIYCTFECKNAITDVVTSGDIEVPEEKRSEDCADGWWEIYFQYPLPFENSINELYYEDGVHVVFPKKQIQDYEQTHVCDSIYYNGKNKEDKILVWKEGDKLEAAPESVEEEVKRNSRIYIDDEFYEIKELHEIMIY